MTPRLPSPPSRLTPTLLLVALALPTAAALQSELESLLAEEIHSAAGRDVDRLWQRAVELREASLLGEEGELDRLLDEALGAAEVPDPPAVLLLAAARLQGEDPDPAVLSHALQPLLAHPDEDLARGAAELLGDPVFRGLSSSARSLLAKGLLKGAKDAGRTPAYRLSCAKSAYEIGGGRERREANRLLKAFLASEDPSVRAQGALALASIDHVAVEGELRDVLERLARVPDEQGALARAYLERDELRELQERRLRDLRTQRRDNGGLPDELVPFVAVLDLVQRRHLEGATIDREELIEAAMNGLLRYMDRHSAYFGPEAYAKFSQDLEAEYGGIGAYVNEDPDDGLFTIVRPIYSGPAYHAGIQTDDKIVRIDDWPTLEKPVDDIIERLKGKPGTPVDLYVWKRGMDPALIDRPTEDMKVTVVRERVVIPPGTYQMLPGGIGLLQLDTFSRLSMDELRKWIPRMLDDGMRALVFDLRFNNGGLLTEAREVADLFLPPGDVVVSTEGREGERTRETLKTVEPALLPENIPLVVLTGRQTASAAEIVSGALQDHGRATLVGLTTYGKGSVQQLLPLLPERYQDRWDDRDGDGLWDPGEPILRDLDGDGEVDYAPRVKLTIARYLLPSGRSIHRELDREGNIVTPGGIQPDIEVVQPSVERWRLEAQRKVLRSNAIREYADAHYAANRELFHRLAVNDGKDPSRYPDFDALMASLDTDLPRDDVRRLLRMEIRRRVQDDLGREFPTGDFVEDVQLQKAIEVALEKLGEAVEDFTEFGLVFDLPREPVADAPGLAALRPDDRGELRRARNLIEAARDGGVVLSEQDLDELLHILGGLVETQKN